MTRKRFKKLFRAWLVQNQQAYHYKGDHNAMRRAFGKQGKIADNYAECWKAISEFTPS